MRGLETIAVSCPLHADSNPCVTPELLSVSCSPALCASRRDPVPITVKPPFSRSARRRHADAGAAAPSGQSSIVST